MKIPLSPPSIDELMMAVSPEVLSRFPLLNLGPLANGQYLHWDELRHRSPPEGLNHKTWWLALRMARSGSAQELPFRDKHGKPFNYSLPEPLLKNLHEIDRGVGLIPFCIKNSNNKVMTSPRGDHGETGRW